MGAVFAAHHEILYQTVAIKLLHTSIARDAEVLQRFLNEARAAARIHSEHVARVMDIGTLESGAPFMVLEYLEGNDLARLLKQGGPLRLQDVVDYAIQAIEAVAQAHAIGIIHRDLKPANLFVANRVDRAPLLKVLDFGISKTTNPLGPIDGGMTSTKTMLGSPFYMSPEQLRSARNVDTRTDVWSFGIVLYELMAGRRPYRGENFGELFSSILEQDPPPLRELRPDVPVELERIVLKCLQRKPEARFSNVGLLALELARFASPLVSADIQRIRQTIARLPSLEALTVAAARRSSPSVVDLAPDPSDTAQTPAIQPFSQVPAPAPPPSDPFAAPPFGAPSGVRPHAAPPVSRNAMEPAVAPPVSQKAMAPPVARLLREPPPLSRQGPDSVTAELPLRGEISTRDPSAVPITTAGAWSEQGSVAAQTAAVKRGPAALVAGVTFSIVVLVGSIGAAVLSRAKATPPIDTTTAAANAPPTTTANAAPSGDSAAAVNVASLRPAPGRDDSPPADVATASPPPSAGRPAVAASSPGSAPRGAPTYEILDPEPSLAVAPTPAAKASSDAAKPTPKPSVDAPPRSPAKPAASSKTPKLDPFGSRHL